MQKILNVIAISSAVAVLSACGGGGGGGDSPTNAQGASITSPQGAVTLANAGTAQNVTPGTVVTLDGSKSLSATGGLLVYNWTLTQKPAGSQAVLVDATSAKPKFTADIAGVYAATLVVNDGVKTSAPVSVTVNVSAGNVAPVAVAGPTQNVIAGTRVVVDGNGSSDFNGDNLSYIWSLTKKPAGSNANILPSLKQGVFVADVAGEYQATLQVWDGKLYSSSSTVTVIASTANLPPVPYAGVSQSVLAGSLVTLDGSGSTDANGDPLTYSWVLTSKPSGSAAILSQANTPHPFFQADIEGTYVATLTVSDGKSPGSSATVAVTANLPKYIGVAYRAKNGLDVTLDSMTKVDLGNGYVNYTINYTQNNPTNLAIDEATFRLYFGNAEAVPQYGFFNRVFPGMPVSRSYSFTQLATGEPTVLQYDADHFFAVAPVPGALQWSVPVANAPITATALKLYQIDSILGNSELVMPYASTLSFNNSVTGNSSSTLQQYQLTAIGQNYTLMAVQATDSSGHVQPRFDGIANGTVVPVGGTIPFSLVTPLTGGQNVSLTYSFTIQETGKTFNVIANGRTN